MLTRLVHRVATPFARLWMAQSSRSWRTLPTPADTPLTHAPGVHADRILLIGAGPAVSYGVLSHDLGLAGHLARRASALTGRGTSVFVRARPGMLVPEAIEALSLMDTGQFDAVVATLGGTEAMTLFPPDRWRAQLDEFIAASPVPVLQVGVPPISSIARMPRLFGSIVTAHAHRINAEAEAACQAAAHATFVPFVPAPGDAVSLASRNTYSDWADLIAPPVAEVLAASFANKLSRPPEDEEARQRSLDAMAILDTAGDEELQRIVDTVRDLFRSSGAGVNIIDRDRQWVMAASGMGRDDTQRSKTMCNETIASGDLLSIDEESAKVNPRWSSNLAPYKFYAGYPIEAPDGHRIGALCIVDNKARPFDDADRTLLRDLAMHTQMVLWERSLRS